MNSGADRSSVFVNIVLLLPTAVTVIHPVAMEQSNDNNVTYFSKDAKSSLVTVALTFFIAPMVRLCKIEQADKLPAMGILQLQIFAPPNSHKEKTQRKCLCA